MPNILAFAALAVWPLVTAVLFRRLPAGRALIASLLAGYLLLPPAPAAFDLPLLPPLGKDSIPALSALLMAVILYRPGLRLWPESRIAQGLVALFILSPVGTVLTNAEPLFWGTYVLPGLHPREALGMMVAQAITLLPFLLARHFLSRPEDQRDLLAALAIGGLAYSLPMLVEVRLSPQINLWVYGFFQHLFSQMVRGDGFRPIVFLYHGLWVAFFAMTTVVAAAALARAQGDSRKLWFGLMALYLFGVLVLCKSFASIFYALALVPAVLLLGQRMQFRIAAVLAAFALVYPMAKAAHWVPEQAIVAAAGRIGPDRAHSLQFRFDNETVLADRAYEKPLFGWGLWGRHHILEENSGRILTVTDGGWILVLGVLGWVGFLAQFGLLCLPLVLVWRRAGAIAALGAPPWAGPVALILAVNVFDLIPNATITPLTWMFAGAVLGLAEQARSLAPRAAAPSAPRLAPIRTVL